MKTLIIYAHPYNQSFNAAILEKTTEKLAKQNKAYEVIDLYQDGFNPLYTPEELKLFSIGETREPLVKQYQKQIKNSAELYIICPIWWNDIPAILKGFFEKVMKKNFAYTDTNAGVKGLLTHINKVTMITTSASPTWYLRFFAGNAIQKVVINASLKQMGIRKSIWINCGSINKKTQQQRQTFLTTL